MSNILTQLRNKRTLKEVADSIGITRQMLGAIEKGKRTPSLHVAKKIADYYGMSIEEIFFN